MSEAYRSSRNQVELLVRKIPPPTKKGRGGLSSLQIMTTNNQTIRSQIARAVAIPVIALTLLLVFIVIYRLMGGPSPEILVKLAEQYYREHGYWIVFVGAIAESILLINLYLPGSLVIALGMVFSRQGTINPMAVVGIATLGFLVGMIFNYLLGRQGWYRLFLRFGLSSFIERARARLLKHGLLLVFATYFHPNCGAVVATGCGILRLPFGRFFIYSSAALLLWNTLWGIVIYLSGTVIIQALDLRYAALALILWAVVVALRTLYRGK